MKTKKVTITLTEEQQEKAKQISKEMFGRENISGLFAYWVSYHNRNKFYVITDDLIDIKPPTKQEIDRFRKAWQESLTTNKIGHLK